MAPQPPSPPRPVRALAGVERERTRLARFEGRSVPTGALLGLERRGWRRSAPEDAGVQASIERAVPGDRWVVVGLDPGIAVGSPDVLPDQLLDTVFIRGAGESHRDTPRVPFGDLDPVTASEIIRDLEDVAG